MTLLVFGQELYETEHLGVAPRKRGKGECGFSVASTCRGDTAQQPATTINPDALTKVALEHGLTDVIPQCTQVLVEGSRFLGRREKIDLEDAPYGIAPTLR